MLAGPPRRTCSVGGKNRKVKEAMLARRSIVLALALLTTGASAFVLQSRLPSLHRSRSGSATAALRCSLSRREALLLSPLILTTAVPISASANADKTVSKFATQAPPTDKDSEPFIYLESGVSFRFLLMQYCFVVVARHVFDCTLWSFPW